MVGWAFGVRMTTDLVTQALDMALMTRMPPSDTPQPTRSNISTAKNPNAAISVHFSVSRP